jgi:hypothetical protein
MPNVTLNAEVNDARRISEALEVSESIESANVTGKV